MAEAAESQAGNAASNHTEMLPSRQRPPLDSQRFDVAVIGGGINGVAIARECACAGKRTLLVECHDFAAGTTSRSTRIIHGGLRYLEHGEFGLVRESLRERECLLRQRRRLVRPLQFLLALPDDGRRSALVVRAGLWFYRALAGRTHTRRPQAEINQLEQRLDRDRGWSVFSFEDAQCEFPERLVAEWLVEAAAAGVVARNYCEVLAIETAHGHVTGLRVRDLLSGHEARVATQRVVNATGPWADRVCAQSAIQTGRPMIGGVRGSHIVLPRFGGAPESALYTEAKDGRPIFMVPWNGQLLVGTTEAPDSSDPAKVRPETGEIEYLIGSVRALFPAAHLAWKDVRYAFAGVRPLPYASGQTPASVTRRHLLHDHAGENAAGLISVIGGKLTTAASLARECARSIGVEVCEPAGPSVLAEFTPSLIDYHIDAVARQAHVSAASAKAMIEWFGPRAYQIARMASGDESLRRRLCPHSEHIAAEALWAVLDETAVSLADILLRRVPVALAPCWSPECTWVAAQNIGQALEWPNTKIAAQAEIFEQERAAFLPHGLKPGPAVSEFASGVRPTQRTA